MSRQLSVIQQKFLLQVEASLDESFIKSKVLIDTRNNIFIKLMTASSILLANKICFICILLLFYWQNPRMWFSYSFLTLTAVLQYVQLIYGRYIFSFFRTYRVTFTFASIHQICTFYSVLCNAAMQSCLVRIRPRVYWWIKYVYKRSIRCSI